LENYDGLGRWRDTDNGVLIDASGDLDGEEFGGPRELGPLIGSHPNFARCLAQTLLRYANGRTESFAELEAFAVLASRFEHHEYRVRPLVLELIASPLFRMPGETN